MSSQIPPPLPLHSAVAADDLWLSIAIGVIMGPHAVSMIASKVGHV